MQSNLFVNVVLSSQMVLQGAFNSGAVRTQVTLERPFTSVGSDVSVHFGLARTPLCAERTGDT